MPLTKFDKDLEWANTLYKQLVQLTKISKSTNNRTEQVLIENEIWKIEQQIADKSTKSVRKSRRKSIRKSRRKSKKTAKTRGGGLFSKKSPSKPTEFFNIFGSKQPKPKDLKTKKIVVKAKPTTDTNYEPSYAETASVYDAEYEKTNVTK